MTKYRVVEDNSSYGLESLVEELLKQGWYPQGGVSSVKDGWVIRYTQAMVKQ